MDNLLEYELISDLGLSYQLGSVACSMVYRQQHPGVLTDCLLAWNLSVPMSELEQLFQAAEQKVATLPAPHNTIEAVAALDPIRSDLIEKVFQQWATLSPETRPDFSIDIQSALFAAYYCDAVNHQRNIVASSVGSIWGVNGVDVRCILQMLDELPLMQDGMRGLKQFVEERKAQYESFSSAVRNSGYLTTDLEPAVRVAVPDLVMATYFLKNHNDPLDYQKLLSIFKIEEMNTLSDLLNKVQELPAFKGKGTEALYNYAKVNYQKYRAFYDKVQKADIYIYPTGPDGVVERKVGLRELVAMRLLEQQHRIDPELVRKLWNMSPEGWEDMQRKMQSHAYIVFNSLDAPVLPDVLFSSFEKEMKALYKAYDQEFGETKVAEKDDSWKWLSDMNEQELIEQVRKHPDVLAGVTRKQLTRRIILEAVRANGFALQHVPLRYVTLSLCREAVSNAGASLRFVPQKYRNNLDLCQLAVKQEPLAYPYVPKKLRSDQRLIDIAITRRKGGYNLLFVPKKAVTAKVVRRAARTTSIKELYELYEKTQKMHKMSEANVRLVQDYNLLMHEQAVPCLGVRNIPSESMELFHERYNQVRDFYEGKVSADELLFSIRWPAFYNELSPLQLHTQVFIDLFPLVEHTPELLPVSPLMDDEPIELPITEVQLADRFPAWCKRESERGGILAGVQITDEKQARPALMALMRMDAQLAFAYRDKQITSWDYFLHPLRNNGYSSEDVSEQKTIAAANRRTEFWNPAVVRREYASKSIKR